MTTPRTISLTPHEAVALHCLGRFRRPLTALELATAMTRMALITREQGAHRIGGKLSHKRLAEKSLDNANRPLYEINRAGRYRIGQQARRKRRADEPSRVMIPANIRDRLMKDRPGNEKLSDVVLLCLRQVLDGRSPEEGAAR
jgi:hypothetical protein